MSEHLTRLPGTEWLMWRQAVLRTAGFPASGLDRFSAPDCAASADVVISSERAGLNAAGKAIAVESFARAFETAVAASTREVHAIAQDPLFREAVTWQSRSVLQALDSLRAAGPQPRSTSKQRQRERIVARYWQRFCAKAETIGFFGPVCWITVDPDAPAVTVKPGQSMLRERRVFLESWALAAYADAVARQPGARELLPPALQPHLTLDGDRLIDPAKPVLRLPRVEAALAARCDGRTPAADIAREFVADPGSGLHAVEDVYLMLGRMADRGVLRWDLDLPVRLSGERVLRERLAALGDERIRDDALDVLDRLCAARDGVAAAAGDPGALEDALARLDAVFTAATGQQASRQAGQMYAGRGLCWEETVRDLNVTIGAPVLTRIAAPMAVMLQASRWVCAAMTEAYLAALRELYSELAAETGSPDVPLGSLWFLAQGLYYGTATRPADRVAAAFASRWNELFGLDRQPTGVRQVTVGIGEAAPLAERIFPAAGPGWSSARVHSPDLHLCADSVASINRGEFTAVLGEMHVAWATTTSGLFVIGHPDPRALRSALCADLGSGRLVPLLPSDWPRYTARLAFALEDPRDAQLGFMPAPGADPDRLLPISSVSVRVIDGDLVATASDGRRWPLAEVFDRQLAEVCVEAFKQTADVPHTPRLILEGLVVGRETWRTTAGGCPLATVTGDRERYLAARAWSHEMGLPDRVFLKIGTETKPVFVDLTSPLLVSTAATMIHAAWQQGGDSVPLTITEVLPDTSESWVPDAAGDRYVSEVRLQFRDPLPVKTPSGGTR